MKIWKYMTSIRKGQHGIAPLNINGTIINNSKDKAEALNCQIQSVFTLEDLIHLPICSDSYTLLYVIYLYLLLEY